MKKSYLLLTSSILLSSFAFAGQAQAESISQNYSSNGSITFETDDSKTDPVDPTNPENPVTPTDPSEPGTDGPLSIDFASNFKFGTQKITTATKTYYAALQTFTDAADAPNYVQVTDKRGTAEGWILSVKQNEQFKTAENDGLKGAVISTSNGTTASIMDDDYRPTTVNPAVNFTPGAENVLVSASANQGMGTWIYKFGTDANEGASAIALEVPGKSVKLAKTYTTTLTWNLKSVPTD